MDVSRVDSLGLGSIDEQGQHQHHHNGPQQKRLSQFIVPLA